MPEEDSPPGDASPLATGAGNSVSFLVKHRAA